MMRKQPFCVSGHEAQSWAISCYSHWVARAWCMCAASSRAIKTLTSSRARMAYTPSASRNIGVRFQFPSSFSATPRIINQICPQPNVYERWQLRFQ